MQFDFPNEAGKPYKSSGGKMVWNELLKREIPVGWEVKPLGEIIIKLDSGKRPVGGIDKALKSGIPSLGAECIDDLGVFDFSSTSFIDFSYRERMSTGKIGNNDILIYKDGAYVGKTTLFRDNFPYEEAFVNEHVFLIHAQEEHLEEYLYFSLKQKTYFQIMQNLGKAKAAQPGLNREDIQSIFLIVPNKEIATDFHKKVELLLAKIFNNAKSIGYLTNLRDTLLPLLMNGQVTLNSCLSYQLKCRSVQGKNKPQAQHEHRKKAFYNSALVYYNKTICKEFSARYSHEMLCSFVYLTIQQRLTSFLPGKPYERYKRLTTRIFGMEKGEER